MHDSTIGFDRPLDDFIVALEIDDDDLRIGTFRYGLTNTDEII